MLRDSQGRNFTPRKGASTSDNAAYISQTVSLKQLITGNSSLHCLSVDTHCRAIPFIPYCSMLFRWQSCFPGKAGGNDDDDNTVGTAVASAATASAEGDSEAGLVGAKQSGEGTGSALGQKKGGNTASAEAVASRPAIPAVSESVHESSMSRDELLAQVSRGR